MKLTSDCSREELARHIGNYATVEMAEALLEELLYADYDRTEQVPEYTWEVLVGRAVHTAILKSEGK